MELSGNSGPAEVEAAGRPAQSPGIGNGDKGLQVAQVHTGDPKYLGYPPDGMNLRPALTGNAAALDRKLFWRYKGKWQHAARIGNYKYLKILDSTFLFDVVEDPLERANLKERRKDIYERLVAEWHRWNATMLPEVVESNTRAFTGEELADHYGS